MLDSNVGQHYLDHFDNKIDLSETPDRRIGVRIMVDFYGSVMAQVGIEALEFDETIKGPSIIEQWEAVSGKLRSLNNADISGEYYTTINDLYRLRNDTGHNFIHQPDKKGPPAGKEGSRGLAHLVS